MSLVGRRVGYVLMCTGSMVCVIVRANRDWVAHFTGGLSVMSP